MISLKEEKQAPTSLGFLLISSVLLSINIEVCILVGSYLHKTKIEIGLPAAASFRAGAWTALKVA